ncbi:MAG: hypothetical protein H6705_20575 [Myxococcales bacterium]|nr:hypothetical protein [Myxococcales bacterium]
MMAWRVLALVMVVAAGAWGCGGEAEETADAGAADAAVDAAAVALGPCGQMGEPTVVLLRSLEFLRVEDGVAEGLDLDGVATAPGDGTGCGKADFTAPDGTPGVDNQFARLLPAIEAVGGADGFQSAIARAINSGGVLVTMELSHLDDAVDDTCVDVTLGRAAGRPALGNDGLIEAGQTFERDTEAPSSAVEGASVAGGVLRAGPFTMALPMVVDDIELRVTIHDMQVRATLHEDGHVTGLLAGAIVLDELNAFLDDIAENTALFAAIRNVLVANADLDPGEDGRCRRISIAVGFEGAPAFFFAP